eukprot:TRINITY_DN70021_c0_g1_i2.p1 TRINITY_DN70021_c0_g1~~TRINITY_DN70021_c0_g1_i2.p1  ORF type:complete len:301 (+),score=14.24 TRINITY_DN70021_c0_g1_i2:51-953(+)
MMERLLFVAVFIRVLVISSGVREVDVDTRLPAGQKQTEFREDRAIEFAKFAGAVYCSNKSLEAWSCGPKCSAPVKSVKVCTGATTQAFVGLWESKCIVSFEGTSNILAGLQDARLIKTEFPWDWCGHCRVHTGFVSEYESLSECVKSKLESLGCAKGSPIRTTGHSLGAAVVTVANVALTNSGWVIEESYNFGSPRVGDASFAVAYDFLFNGRSWRVTHAKDPVPQLPPDILITNWHFEHTVPEIYYKGSVADGHEKCLHPEEFRNCIQQYWNFPLEGLSVEDHLDYMGVHTGSAGCENK